MRDYTLGLDLGPNSIGWALIETEFEREYGENGELLRLNPVGYMRFLDTSKAGHPPIGVRVFEAGLDNFGTMKEKSLSQERRLARSMRRTHARRQARRRALRRVLTEAGFLPSPEDEFNAVMVSNPYELRAKGLDARLEPHELGRAIFHLAQRRGFKSNRKAGASERKENKKTLEEIQHFGQEIQASGARTLGEYLYRQGWADGGESLRAGRSRLRNRHTHRDMYRHELALLLDAQTVHHPSLDGIAAQIRHYILHQHPFEVTEERRRCAPSRANLHRAPQVRGCALEPGEAGCPLTDLLAQRFRILKQVNDLRIREPGATDWRVLSDAERDTVTRVLSEQKSLSFDSLRKKFTPLGTHPESFFNLEKGDRTALKGNAVEAPVARAVGLPHWRELSPPVRARVLDLVLREEDDDSLRRELVAIGLDTECIDGLIALDVDQESGYLRYSRKAIKKIIPFMEAGADEYNAVQKAYPERKEAAEWRELPSLVHPELPEQFRDITNPVVRRALVEVRKVVNAIVREHGKPTQIVVELAREMKSGPKRRSEYSARIRAREAERRDAAEAIRGMGGNPDSGADVLRYLLWKQQGCECLYTGRGIPQTSLFTGAVDIDHILPRWQSLDDSQGNKLLCYREANHDKGQRTPIQWLSESSREFEELLRRMIAVCEAQDPSGLQKRYSAIEKRNLPVTEWARAVAELPGPWPARLRRILQEDVAAESFAERQLNDTQYISKMAVAYLGSLYPPGLRVGEKAVRSTRGGLTAELRRHWGLGRHLLGGVVPTQVGDLQDSQRLLAAEKSRTDHRHHAIDAVIVALSSRGSLKRYQDFWRAQEQGGSRKSAAGTFPLPWGSLPTELQDHLQDVNVSHRVMRKLSGAFHEDTYYGPVRDAGGEVTTGHFVTRKRLESLSGKDVQAETTGLGIRDPQIKRLIVERLLSRGWDGKATALPKEWAKEPLLMPSGVPIRRVRVVLRKDPDKMLLLGDRQHRAAVLGNNHHLAVYETKDKKGETALRAVVVPQVVAARRIRRVGAPAIDPSPETGGRLVISFARKESVLVTDPRTGERALCVVQKLTGDSAGSATFDLCLRMAPDSRPAAEASKDPFLRLRSFKEWRDLVVEKVQVDPLGRVSPSND